MKNVLIFVLLYPNLLLSQNFLSNKNIKLPPELPEASGLYVANPDSLWWINDSGNSPDLFITDSKGNLMRRVGVPSIENKDWEDLTADDEGNIYIGDFGNNANQRQDLKIYKYNPSSYRLDTIQFSYEDQTAFPPAPPLDRFDSEAMIWYRDSLHLFTKDRVGRGIKYTKHYILPTKSGIYQARLVDSLALKKRVVTGAAIHPANKKLVLLTYNYRLFLGFIPFTPSDLYVINDFSDSSFFTGRMMRKKVARKIRPTQFEAIDFVLPNLLLAGSERVLFFRQKGKYIKLF